MPDNNDPDIVGRIDELTEPGPDAATWTPDNPPEQPQWGDPSPGTMFALMMTRGQPELVELSCDDPRDEMSRLLDDTRLQPLTPLSGAGFWVGRSTEHPKDLNYGAGLLVAELLDDALAGHYVVSDEDRDRLLGRLGDSAEPPLIHGPCLLTGIDADGAPTALPDALARWATQAMQRHQDRLDAAVHTLALYAGINPHDVRGIGLMLR